MNPHMLPKVRSKVITRAMQGYPCTLRIASFAGMQCSSHETTVAAHLPVAGKGMGTKVTDMATVASCQLCHDLLDLRDPRGMQIAKMYPGAWADRLINALVETQAMLIRDGVIIIDDPNLEIL